MKNPFRTRYRIRRTDKSYLTVESRKWPKDWTLLGYVKDMDEAMSRIEMDKNQVVYEE